MHYPPQQEPPMHQPPAEIYISEPSQAYQLQPPVYAPQYEPPVPGQEIAISFKRGLAIFVAAMCTVAVLLLISLPIITFFTNGPLQPSDIAPMIATLVVICVSSGVLGWLGWRLGFQQLFSPKTILVINHEGITVSKVRILRSGFFLSWADIDSMYTYSIGYAYLCIRPKNIEQFLSRFKGRMYVYRYSKRIGAPILIPQFYLDRSVEEILQQVYSLYANEISYYHVQILS